MLGDFPLAFDGIRKVKLQLGVFAIITAGTQIAREAKEIASSCDQSFPIHLPCDRTRERNRVNTMEVKSK